MKKSNLLYSCILGIYSLFIVPPSADAQYIITTIAGNGTPSLSGDGGPATAAAMYSPAGVAVDGSGNVFIADYSNGRIRKVSASGIITTVAGGGGNDDGQPATIASLDDPRGVAVDGSGNIYIADLLDIRVRKVDASGIIHTVAGNRLPGYTGDGGPATAARLSSPCAVAMDGSGNLFIADYNNNDIRKVSASDIITTVAGEYNGTTLGDGGPATAASMDMPYSVAVDGSGNLFIADTYNNRIRKVNTSGIISTVAGNGTQGYSGDGGAATAAELYAPIGVAVDNSGNLFIADDGNNRIRKVNTSGTITTIAGNGTGSFGGDGGEATSAQLYGPNGVAVDGNGNVYIGDYGNNRVRKLSPNAASVPAIGATIDNTYTYPNPAHDKVHVAVSNRQGLAYKIIGMAGNELLKGMLQQGNNDINISELPEGVYVMEVMDEKENKTVRKIVKE